MEAPTYSPTEGELDDERRYWHAMDLGADYEAWFVCRAEATFDDAGDDADADESWTEPW